MKTSTVTKFGTQLGVALPQDFVRALGWVKGDKLACFIEGGNIVFRNSSQRSAKFFRDFRARPDQRLAADAR